MNNSNELISQLRQLGLTNHQIEQCLVVTQQWLDKFFPVLGELSRKELKELTSQLK